MPISWNRSGISVIGSLSRDWNGRPVGARMVGNRSVRRRRSNPLAPDGGRNSGWIQSPSADAPAASFVTCLPASDGRSRLPRGTRIFEWTRCIAEVSERQIAGVPISNILRPVSWNTVSSPGSKPWWSRPPKLVNLLVTTGWDVMPLAAPSVLDDALIVPITAKRHWPGCFVTTSSTNQWKRLDLTLRTAIRSDRRRCRASPFIEDPHGHVQYERLAGE